MSRLVLAAIDEATDYPDPDSTPYPSRPPGVHRPGCGRFAKYLRTERYYNGTWDCMRGWTHCSKCGEQSEEYV